MIKPINFLLFLTILTTIPSFSLGNTYEFMISGQEQKCLGEHFASNTYVVVHFVAMKTHEDSKEQDLETSLSAFNSTDLFENHKDIKRANISIEFTSDTGLLVLGVLDQDRKEIVNIHEDEYVSFCFKNEEAEDEAIVIFDVRTGYHAADIKEVPTSTDRFNMIEKLESIRVMLDNSLRLYRQMEVYEEKWAKRAGEVLNAITWFGAIILMAIVVVSWGIVLAIEKGVNERKNK